MAKLNWQKPATDAAIAIAGGQIVQTKLLPMIPMVGDLLAKLPPEVAGVSVPLLVAGAATLVVVRNYIMK